VSYFSEELGRSHKLITYHIERASIRRADFWCAVSQYAADKTAALFKLPAAAAISYVPVEVGRPIALRQRERHRVIYTGTLTPKKGVISLMNAWRIVKRRHPEAELHLLGKDTVHQGGSMKHALLSRLHESDRTSVHFSGHVSRDRLLQELTAARVAVFPSYAEAFAFAPMEAMAAGCPTIYSRRSSGSELIRHGHDGVLIDPDNTEELAAAIVSMLEDDQLAERLSLAGQERVRHNFAIQKLVPRIEEFYRHCIQNFPLTSTQLTGNVVNHRHHLHHPQN
jgi:glycosyltransferase involved in cell wall biosynthesis